MGCKGRRDRRRSGLEPDAGPITRFATTCWIDDCEEQDSRVLAQTLREAASIPAGEPGISKENRVCQEMWRSLHPVHVIVPFAEKIRFSSNMNRRNPDMLLDLVRAHAVMMQYQRERDEVGTMTCITATIEDFRQACQLYMALNGQSDGQQLNLTRKESELVDAIRSRGQSEITVPEIQHLTGLSYSVIYKMLHGSMSRGYQYSGLLEKCPAVSVCDRTLVTDESSSTAAHRRAKAYTWDPSVYDTWASDGGCWLEGNGPDYQGDGEDPDDGNAEGFGKNAELSAPIRDPDPGDLEEYLSNNNYFSTHNEISESIEQAISDPAPVCDHTPVIQHSAKSDHPCLSESPDSQAGRESGGPWSARGY